MRFFHVIAVLSVLFGILPGQAANPEQSTPPKEALQPFNLLIGTWKGAGVPEGTADERQKGHWVEKITWVWQFKDADAWLTIVFDDGKYFSKGELHATADPNRFELRVTTVDKKTLTFLGNLKDKKLTLERVDDASKETQRLVFTLLHSNRFLYRYELKPAGKTFYTILYQVGATKEGVPFVEVGAPEKECVVSGGLGTSTVMYEGKTYYVCCSGCRDAFKDNPAKYVKEFEAKRKKNDNK